MASVRESISLANYNQMLKDGWCEAAPRVSLGSHVTSVQVLVSEIGPKCLFRVGEHCMPPRGAWGAKLLEWAKGGRWERVSEFDFMAAEV